MQRTMSNEPGSDVCLCRPCHNKVHNEKTHCKYGHPLSGDNLYVRPSGKSQCRQCLSDRQRERNAARRGPNPTHGNAKITNEEVVKIREEYRRGGVTHKEIAERYGVNRSLISMIISGKRRRMKARGGFGGE
jgi:hypothetical protein